MLGFLFRRLTGERPSGAALFDAATAEARQHHWYVEGQVPDTLDGRFAILATINALILVRLEQLGERGNLVSVALTERFITVMESEHRELGLGDPTLGKKVRRLVASLAHRVELWRGAALEKDEWLEATRKSVYKDGVGSDALRHTGEALRRFWTSLQSVETGDLEKGRLN